MNTKNYQIIVVESMWISISTYPRGCAWRVCETYNDTLKSKSIIYLKDTPNYYGPNKMFTSDIGLKTINFDESQKNISFQNNFDTLFICTIILI